MWKIYKTTSFESAHLLQGHSKCGKLHGHSYKLEVWADSSILETQYGFVLDFHWISDIAKKYDHSDKVIEVSCETLSRMIAMELMQKAKDESCALTKLIVRVWETPTSYAEYQC